MSEQEKRFIALTSAIMAINESDKSGECEWHNTKLQGSLTTPEVINTLSRMALEYLPKEDEDEDDEGRDCCV